MGDILESGKDFEIVEDETGRVYKIIKQIKFSKAEKKFIDEVMERAIRGIKILPEETTDNKTIREKLTKDVISLIDQLISAKGGKIALAQENIEATVEYVTNNMIGYGALSPLLNDDNLEEVMVIGVNVPVFVAHREYGVMRTNIIFEEDSDIHRIIEKIGRYSGRKIDHANPLLDARLPDGSRVNATLVPSSLDGSTITIRKFKEDSLTIIDLINFKTLGTDVAAFLWLAVDGLRVKPSNILVSGGTGSGKTTTLNCLSLFIPTLDRVISIEDTAELQLPMEHKIRLETKPPSREGTGGLTFNKLLINTLRMRPDRLILGEVRGEEAATLFVAMNTGHDGCMGTVHANNANETVSRLLNPPMNVPMIMMGALDIIVMQNRVSIGGKIRRRITEIAEVAGQEVDKVLLNRIFLHDPKDDLVKSTGTPSRLIQDVAAKAGVSPAEVNTEIDRRKLVLDYLVSKDIIKHDDVYSWIMDYYKNPDALLDKMAGGV